MLEKYALHNVKNISVKKKMTSSLDPPFFLLAHLVGERPRDKVFFTESQIKKTRQRKKVVEGGVRREEKGREGYGRKKYKANSRIIRCKVATSRNEGRSLETIPSSFQF